MSWFPYKDFHYEMFSQEKLNELYGRKKLFIFDLDETLISMVKYSKDDREKIVQILKKLKDTGKKIAIASHNSNPARTLSGYPKLHELFDKDDIIGPLKISKNDIKDEYKIYDHYVEFRDYVAFYPAKSEMIKQLANKHGIDLDDVIFFDDDKGYIKQSLDINVTGILLEEKIGLLDVFPEE